MTRKGYDMNGNTQKVAQVAARIGFELGAFADKGMPRLNAAECAEFGCEHSPNVFELAALIAGEFFNDEAGQEDETTGITLDFYFSQEHVKRMQEAGFNVTGIGSIYIRNDGACTVYYNSTAN